MHGSYRGLSDESRIQPLSSLHMGWTPSSWKFKLTSAFKPLRTFRTLSQEALKTAVVTARVHFTGSPGGAVGAPGTSQMTPLAGQVGTLLYLFWYLMARWPN